MVLITSFPFFPSLPLSQILPRLHKSLPTPLTPNLNRRPKPPNNAPPTRNSRAPKKPKWASRSTSARAKRILRAQLARGG
ncbi:hypothetical protein K458DRAFT_28267 [Lentithecium fluviatile CBS 122367]|uniref:Uncharacterized protein n=1 Tax=Lentithecium fluviatile CBS 122367 TaxID=1168545 RepID=A0A6G1J319_9PLEO|nr:hypothetical protein K458DRAFT_28267 [Lentithecium fluviatile CBS 122367]